MPEDGRRPTSEELIRQARDRLSRRAGSPDDSSAGPGADSPGPDADEKPHQRISDGEERVRPSSGGTPIDHPDSRSRTELPAFRPVDLGRRTRPGTIGWIVASSIFGVAIVAGAIADSQTSQTGAPASDIGDLVTEGASQPADLAVGDCVMLPKGVGFDERFEFETLKSVPCDEPHDMEVFATFNHSPGRYPGEDGLFAFADHYCPGAFEEYTGLPYEHEARLVINTTVPDSTGWSQGDHSVECLVQSFDGERLIGKQEGNGLLGMPGLEVSQCYDIIDEDSFVAFTEAGCDDVHDVELFHVSELSHGEQVGYPGEEWLDSLAGYRCAAQLEPYLGEILSPEAEMTNVWVVPNEVSWDAGDRMIYCFLVPTGSDPGGSSV